MPDPIILSTRISRAASATPGYAAARSLQSLVKDEIRTAFVRADDFVRAGSSRGCYLCAGSFVLSLVRERN